MTDMKTNLIYAYRNIKNNSTNSIITVVGLSVAIACSLIIYFYISQEYSYNKFHENIDRLFRINYSIKYIDYQGKDVRVEPILAERIKKDIPQVEKSAEYRYAFLQTIGFQDNYFDVNTSYASEDFFSMFSFPFISGSSASIFTNPDEIVITKKIADKILAGKNKYDELLYKNITFPLGFGNTPFKIVGVIEDIPKNSSIDFDVIISGKSMRSLGGCDNFIGYTSVYYLIKENADAGLAEKNVLQLLNTYYKERVIQMQEQNELVKTDDAFVPFILPMKDVYINGDINNCFERSVEKSNFIILISICLLILIIACSNYTILSLGQYLKKIGDVGIRKAMGATPGNIFYVFLSESFLLTFSSFIIGGILCVLALPVFENLSQTKILTESINIPKVISFGAILFLSVSIITSIIPVMVFSKVSPNQMAGNKINVGNKSKLSQVFVSVQYSLSIILIIVTLFILKQTDYMKNRSIGMDTSNIIDIDVNRIPNDKKETFKEMLRQNPAVTNLTMVCRNFLNGSSNDYVNKGDGEKVSVFKFRIDPDYISTLGLNLLYGKNCTAGDMNPSSQTMIVNQSFIEAFGIEDDPIGKSYNISGVNFTIIGVVNDFNYFNLRQKVYPAMLHTNTYYGNGYSDILLRYQPNQLKSVVEHIKKCYEEVAPGKTLTHFFWNERLNERYETEDRWSKIIGWASAIAIIISTLGLYGLTVLLINQKIKEIGVRKVNGAKISEVLISINKTFFGWLIGSLIIAIPVSYIIVNNWLSNFQYKVKISWWIFILAGLIAFLIALGTISLQSWKAARRNPVEALRYE